MTGPVVQSSAFSARWRRRLRRAAAASLHPSRLAASIPGPVFVKEAQLIGRRASTYWTRGGYCFLLFCLVGLVFIGVYLESSSGSDAAKFQKYQQIAPVVTIAIIWFQYVLLTVCAASLCSGAVCEERRKGTLSALLTTPLTASQILLGKIAGGCVQLFVLALFSTPLLLAMRVFGGVPAETILGALALTVSMSLLAATLAAWHSMHMRRSATAMLAALFSAAVIQLGPALFALILNLYNHRPPPWLYTHTCTTIGMAALTADLVEGTGAGIPFPVWLVVKASTAYTLAWTLLIFFVASINLRWRLGPEAAGGPSLLTGPAPEQPATDEPAGPRKKVRARRTPRPHLSREVSDRPVLWRELRQTAFRRRWIAWAITFASVALLAFLYFEADIFERPLHFVLIAILSVLTICSAAVASTAAISGEAESRTIDSLLSTPLSASEIVLGKFAGALRRLWCFPSVLFAHLLFACLAARVLHPITLLHVTLLLGPAVAMLVASGVWLSTLFKKSTVAAAFNFGFALGAWALLPLGVGLFVNLVFQGQLADDAMSIAALINPVPMAVVAVGGGFIDPKEAQTYYVMFDLGRIGVAEFTLTTLAFGALYAALTFGFILLATRRLAAATGRLR